MKLLFKYESFCWTQSGISASSTGIKVLSIRFLGLKTLILHLERFSYKS